MTRIDVNRSGEMEVFVRVVELGGFSAAARALAMTPSAVSKLVARLESRLGVRLLNRSTRQVQLTAEGGVFYERSVRVLADLADAERGAASQRRPAGRLSINANVPFGEAALLPLVPRFLERYPDIALDIVLTDKVIDLIEQRTDVAVRAGPLKSSSLVARKLGETRKAIVGAPAYLARHGVPRTPADLAQHNCLGFNITESLNGWPLLQDGRVVRCRRWATRASATARPCSAWPWPASAWPAWRCSTPATTSPPAAWCPCWRTSIRATSRRSTRSSSATAAGCRRGCGRSSTSSSRTCGSEDPMKKRPEGRSCGRLAGPSPGAVTCAWPS